MISLFKCDHDWVEIKGEFHDSNGPFYDWERDEVTIHFNTYRKEKCRKCREKRRGETIEVKSKIIEARDLY